MSNLRKEIQEMSIDTAINEIVQYFKSVGDLKDKTLVVPLRFTAEDYNTNKSFFKEITLVYHGSSYTMVGYSESDKFNIKYNKTDDLDIYFECYHDSCWRDGTSRIIRKIAGEAEKVFNENDKPNVFNSFGITSIELIDVKLKGDYGIEKITIIRP